MVTDARNEIPGSMPRSTQRPAFWHRLRIREPED
jgi:hypothetical protein